MGLLARRNANSLLNDSFFDDFFRDPWGTSLTRPVRYNNLARYPIRSMKTDDGTYKFEFDVPGAGKDDIEILYDEDSGILSVSSKMNESSEEEKSVSSRTFSYQISVYDMDSETIEASCDRGILVITGKPITKQASQKRIEIK